MLVSILQDSVVSRLWAGFSIMTPPMLRPDYKEFSRLAGEATLVPVVKSVAADLLTPVSAFLAIASREPDAFLLESVERGGADWALHVSRGSPLHAGASRNRKSGGAAGQAQGNSRRQRHPSSQRTASRASAFPPAGVASLYGWRGRLFCL